MGPHPTPSQGFLGPWGSAKRAALPSLAPQRPAHTTFMACTTAVMPESPLFGHHNTKVSLGTIPGFIPHKPCLVQGSPPLPRQLQKQHTPPPPLPYLRPSPGTPGSLRHLGPKPHTEPPTHSSPNARPCLSPPPPGYSCSPQGMLPEPVKISSPFCTQCQSSAPPRPSLTRTAGSVAPWASTAPGPSAHLSSQLGAP